MEENLFVNNLKSVMPSVVKNAPLQCPQTFHCYGLIPPLSAPPSCVSPRRAIEKLTGHQFEDYSFKVSYIVDMDAAPPDQAPRTRRGGRSSRDQGGSQPGTSGDFGAPHPRQLDLPMRILVPNQMVGAIIGKGGQTIKDVTKQTHSK